MSPRLLLKFVWCIIWGTFRALFSCCCFRRSKAPDLSADVCLVTGAGQGIGRHTALLLAQCGATLVLWDIDGEKVRSVANEIRESGGNAHPYVVDCSKRDEVYRVAALVRSEVGDVAVLINNAGVFFMGNYVSGELSDEQIEKTFSVNALAHYWTVRAFLPWMVENDYGRIVNVASAAAFIGLPYMSAYCATKSAVASFTETLRYELLHKKGISVSCVYLALVNTSMIVPNVKEILMERNTPISHPEDVARVIVHGIAEKKEDIFVPYSLRSSPLFKAVTPYAALHVLTQYTRQVFEMSTQKKRE